MVQYKRIGYSSWWCTYYYLEYYILQGWGIGKTLTLRHRDKMIDAIRNNIPSSALNFAGYNAVALRTIHGIQIHAQSTDSTTKRVEGAMYREQPSRHLSNLSEGGLNVPRPKRQQTTREGHYCSKEKCHEDIVVSRLSRSSPTMSIG